MIGGLLNSRATITRTTFVTSGPEPTPTTATVASDVPCRVCNMEAQEQGPAFDPQVMRVLLYFPYGTDVTNHDRVTVSSVVYELEGVDNNAGAQQHHVEVTAKRID